MKSIVRDVVLTDLPEVTNLLNALLGTTNHEYTETAHTAESTRRWFDSRIERGFPVLVAERCGVVVGFASYGDFRDSVARPGYRHTVEHSVHVSEDTWGQGIGRILMERLIERARAADVHVMVGAIDAGNVDSILFHERLGFVETARMPQVGRKFDRWRDLVMMQMTVGLTTEDGSRS